MNHAGHQLAIVLTDVTIVTPIVLVNRRKNRIDTRPFDDMVDIGNATVTLHCVDCGEDLEPENIGLATNWTERRLRG